MQYYTYIMFSQKNGTLYIGVTNDLARRAYEHRNGLLNGFTKKYNVHKLGYYEVFDDVNAAIIREKQLKNWHRDWKINLINQNNPNWDDLFDELF